jgi:hypothetical protein
MNPQRKKSHGVSSSEWGGQGRRLLSQFTAHPVWLHRRRLSFYEPSSSIFNCISLQNTCLFTLSAGVRACTNHILYGLKHSHLRNTVHTMRSSLHALATDLRGLCWNASHTLSVLSSDTRGRPGLLPLHKHPVSTNYQYHLVMFPSWKLALQ